MDRYDRRIGRKCGDHPNRCRCSCYGCCFHCTLHWPLWSRVVRWPFDERARFVAGNRWLDHRRPLDGDR